MNQFEKREARLRCNKCGHEWAGSAWYESTDSDEEKSYSWNIASGNAAEGNECPECKSRFIGAHLLS